jgi:beta-N-acetylhexosaminidase
VPGRDVPVTGADDSVGDRAFSADPAVVADLGRVMAQAMLDGGVQPVVKHLPGHGRADADSHLALPRVDASRAMLSGSDFLPFEACRDMPWGMTAHILYSDIDADRPATLSETVIGEIIRGEIGFDGVLMTDDLSMAALGGDYADRTRAALAAGCDVALHCNGRRQQMEAVASGAGAPSAEASARLARARAAAARAPEPIDHAAAEARLADLLAGA